MKVIYKIYADGKFSHYEYSKDEAKKAREYAKSLGFVKNYIKGINTSFIKKW